MSKIGPPPAPSPAYQVIGDAAAELLGYLETRADPDMLFAIGMLIAAHGVDKMGERAGPVRVNVRARLIDEGAINATFGGAPRIKPSYALRDALNAGRVVEIRCSQCAQTLRRASVDEIAFMDAHSMSDWPQTTCPHCGHEGIGVRTEYRRPQPIALTCPQPPDDAT